MGIGSNSIISFGDTGVSNQVLTPNEIVKEKLKFLLRTNKGEIPNDLDYGADLIHFTYKPIDDRMKIALEMAVRGAVAQYMSYVLVKKIEVTSSSQGCLLFKLFYDLAEGFEDEINIELRS